jgi:hypothetical protein
MRRDFDGSIAPLPSGSLSEISWEAPDGTDTVVHCDVSEDREVLGVFADSVGAEPLPALLGWLLSPAQEQLREKLIDEAEQAWRDGSPRSAR